MAPDGQLVAGHYRLLRTLGAGGMGRVWLAADEVLHRQVAIKKCALPAGLNAAEQDLVRGLTLREAQAFARISHPNVVRIVDVRPDEDGPWIVMEYVASRSLLQVVNESGGLPPERVAAIGLAVLSGLGAAFRAGLLHLDVKPENILMGDDGRIVLSDFGPAVTDRGIRELAGLGIILGSPKYLAPERLRGGSGPQSDLWSLGATLYHAVEGHPPYVRDTTEATLRALAAGPPDPPRRAGPLTGVLEGLLRRDPADRLTPAETEDLLRRVAEGAGPPAVEAPVVDSPVVARPVVDSPVVARPVIGMPVAEVPAARPARIGRRARRRALVAAAALAVAGALAAVFAATGRPGEPVAARPPVPASPSPRALPPHFGWWADPAGFRVGVPDGWRRGRDRTGALTLTAPQGRPGLRISRWTAPARTTVATFIAAERDVRLPGYRRIRIEALPEPPDAVWEYTYRDPAAGPMRGLRRVLISGGRPYLIEWQAPRPAWATDLPTYTVVLDSFGPPGA